MVMRKMRDGNEEDEMVMWRLREVMRKMIDGNEEDERW